MDHRDTAVILEEVSRRHLSSVLASLPKAKYESC
jgi:hypothetical protein